MKTINTLLFASALGLSSLTANSQSLTLPAPSPAASVSQTFGLTKIEINYSSPGVKGRPIWGALVPYDSIWRTGANGATTISFSTDVMIAGTTVKQGKYALFTIPGKNIWTVILNSNPDQFGAFDYKKSMDVARFTVSTQPADFKERMAFMIEAQSDSTATVSLWWEKLKVSFNVMANARALAKKNIEAFAESSGNLWRSYANSANYYVDNNMDLKKAHEWAEMSVNMKENFFNRYVMAKVLRAEGNIKDAIKYANEAKALGEKANDEPYQNSKARVEKLIADLNAEKK
jgi:hypothetical protein